ncbi:MAG: ABC transporter permease subunit [Lachnospiraceae bacterium]|nr:ABC transporter permease subunit [Lachnospiraceae bacterium]
MSVEPVKEKHKIRLWAVLFWMIVWQLASMWLDSDILLVSPVKVVYRLSQLMMTAAFWKAVCFTLLRIASGFFLAVATGVTLAAVSSHFTRAQELLAPFMLAVKSVPVASFIILALIWFSSRNLSILISFLMVLPIIYTSVLSGIRSVDRQLLEMAYVFRIPKLRVVRYIYLPQIMPFFYSACSVALGMSWKAGAAAEVIGIPKGSIGERLQQAKVYLDTPDLFAWTLVIVAASLFFEKIVLYFMSKVVEKFSAMCMGKDE